MRRGIRSHVLLSSNNLGEYIMLTVLGILDGDEYRADLDKLTDSIILAKHLSTDYKAVVMVFDGVLPLIAYQNGNIQEHKHA
jgi:hypothetical protein